VIAAALGFPLRIPRRSINPFRWGRPLHESLYYPSVAAVMAVFMPRVKKDPGLVLVTETDYLPTLMNLLDQARVSVDLLAFSFAAGSADGHLNFRGVTFKVMEKLKTLRAGVRVRTFMEGERDTAARNRVTGTHLEKAGIEVRYGSTHAKGVCVDGRYLLIGSSNLTDQSLTKNYETNVLIDHPATTKQFTKYFEHYWEGGGHGKVRLKAPLIADGGWKPELLAVIAEAKKQLAFSIYFFDQAEVEAALIAAHRRGVRLIGLIHNHKSFGLDDVRRTRRTVARLREAGLDDLHFADPSRFTHSKYLVADGKTLMLGTGNWLDRDVTTYPQLYVRLPHPGLCRALVKHLRGQIGRL